MTTTTKDLEPLKNSRVQAGLYCKQPRDYTAISNIVAHVELLGECIKLGSFVRTAFIRCNRMGVCVCGGGGRGEKARAG